VRVSPSATVHISPTPSATATATNLPTATRTLTNSPTATLTRTATPSATASVTRTPSQTASASGTATLTPTPSATRTATRTSTATPSQTPTLTRTQTATDTPTRTPTVSATATPTRTATVTRSATPTITPLVSATPTATFRTIGGEITAFGVARADGRIIDTIGPDDHGYLTYVRPPSGFLIYVEAHPGISGRPVGSVTFRSDPTDPNVLPDLQMVASRVLGNGSTAVCDVGPAPNQPLGGVPAVDPPMFGGSQGVSNAINDLGCRFDARGSTALACTRDPFQQVEAFVNPNSTVQFCTTAGVGSEMAFSIGDTILTARVLDVVGQPGHPMSIVIRVLGP
jgi:hypothetical protein